MLARTHHTSIVEYVMNLATSYPVLGWQNWHHMEQYNGPAAIVLWYCRPVSRPACWQVATSWLALFVSH